MRRKVYGQSKMERCPLCGSAATVKNKEGLPVCRDHQGFSVELTCACGRVLEPKESKYGTFFTCHHCGPVSWRKAMDINGLE